MTIQRLAFAAFLLILRPTAAHADFAAEFAARIRSEIIKPMALDIGGLLGAASVHNGRALGMPGFYVGAQAVVQEKPDRNNLVLREIGIKAFGLPLIEAGVGLPFKIDVVGHGMSAAGITVFGGGLRWGLFAPGFATRFLPFLGIGAFADKVNHANFNATHAAVNAAASWKLPIVSPFLGAGLDVTKLNVGSAQTAGVAGLSATATGSRFTAGLDLVPFPFARVRLAYHILHGISAGGLSLGAQF